MGKLTILLQLFTIFCVFRISIQRSDVKCLVCRLVVNEITKSVAEEDPKKTLQVGSFRIQPDGSQQQSQIKYAGSETHLGEILETVCNSLEDYAQAKHKETNELTLLNLSKDVDKLSTYELVQDLDMNRSLKYYCESFIEDYEDNIISLFKSSDQLDKFDTKLCTEFAGYCKSLRSEL